MNIKSRISILMGIFNCADTLPEALDSLYAQTYQDFKLILCDDGSTDNTYEVAKAYADKHDNIILLQNKENIKLAATLNRCLEHADTEYIARMDGDDISLPTRFEKQIEFLDSHPEYAVVSAPMIYFDETGEWGVGRANPTPDKNSFRNGTPHTHAPSMVRTAVMKEVGGYTVSKYLERGQDVKDFIIDRYTGLLPKFNNVDDFVESILLLKENYDLYNYISYNAYNMIRSSFKPEIQTERLNKILTEIQ